LHAAPPPLFLAAVVSSLPPVKDKPRHPSFLLFGSPGAHQACTAAGCRPWRLLEPRPDHTGAPLGPPPLPSFSAVASPSPSSSPASPSHGEQYPPLNFFSSTALWRAHKLAGAAAPPPSSTGRRRGTINPLDPPCHVRTRLRYEMHQLVDKMMAESTVQGRRREPPPRAAALR
jgi:hypothetical protein